MARNPERFVELLVAALLTIRAQSGRSMAAIQDELGYALGREGSSYIAYLRRGHPPMAVEDIEQLAHALIVQGGLDQARCEAFLQSAGHRRARAQTAHWFRHTGDGAMNTIQPTPSPISPPDEGKPFIAGPPITWPRHFFGRERELRRIFTTWRRPPFEHIALIGPRRSGKTSLLHYLRQITQTSKGELRPDQRSDWLPNPEDYRWLHIDFLDSRMRQQEPFLRALLTGWGIAVPDDCSLDHFLEIAGEHAWSHPCIVLLDEIGAALTAADFDQALWWGLRALLNSDVTHGKLAFLVAGHAAPEQLAQDAGKVSPFFNMFNGLSLGPFTEAEATALITAAPTPFPPADVAWILEKSGRWPLLVQILCQERWLALEDGDRSDDWQAEGLRRLAAYPSLVA
jgi:hypothetical protein